MRRRRVEKSPRPRTREFANRPLAALAKQAPATPVPEPQPQPAPVVSEDPEPSDDELFASAMQDVALLADRPAGLPVAPAPPVRPDAVQLETEEVVRALRDLVSGDSPLAIHLTDEAIEGAADGLDPRIMRRLRRGDFAIQDHLDLHGTTRDEARTRVEQFLVQAVAAGMRCVLIIHGRGHGSKDKIPVLKTALRSWFVHSAIRKHILAFTTARQCDGGGGAVYVLLRKARPVRP